MVETLEAITAETPLVLVLEDLYWSDTATLDLLASLARRQEAARLLLTGTYRPVEVIVRQHLLRGLKQELQLHGHCTELPLGGLTEADIAAYLAVRFPGSVLPPELAWVLLQRTEGNPLFIVTVVEYLVTQGILVQGKGGWELTEGVETVERGVPESLRQMIERPIAQLSPEDQRALEVASIVGIEFSAAAVAAGLTAEAQVEERCTELARRRPDASGAGERLHRPGGTARPHAPPWRGAWGTVPGLCGLDAVVPGLSSTGGPEEPGGTGPGARPAL